MDSNTSHKDVIVNYYKVLGCDRTATRAELKKTCRNLILRYHPDKPGGNNENFLLIQKAWDIFKDPAKRKIYDATLFCHEENESLLYETISLRDMDSVGDGYFTYSCRCGGSYVLDQDVEFKQKSLIIPCDECSFSIKCILEARGDDGS